jgi:hypothetical protein
MTNFDLFIDTVKQYAKAYNQLEKIQRDKSFDFVPIGDQKTGVIGEAFIFEYLKRQGHPDVKFGSAAQKAWDINHHCFQNKIRTPSVPIQVMPFNSANSLAFLSSTSRKSALSSLKSSIASFPPESSLT